MTAGGGVGVHWFDALVGVANRIDRELPRTANQIRAALKPIAELIAAAANVSERIAYYAELGENATPTIEDWAYTDQSGDVARLRSALAALEQQP